MNTLQPSVTFALLAYNQAKYVCEAVTAALAQTYSPLEIIIRDDASTDGTQAKILDTLSRYSGNHIVRLSLNESNVGISEQINRIFREAKGELIILAAGDDISKPNRTSRTVDAWLERSKIPSAIYCGMEMIGPNGESYGRGNQAIRSCRRDAGYLIRRIHNPPRLLVGACSSYTPRVISEFSDLSSSTLIEDTPLTVRASIISEVAYIDDVLVSYRTGTSTWLAEQNSPRENLKQRFTKRLKLAQAQRSALVQVYIDMKDIGSEHLAKFAEHRIEAKDLTVSILGGKRVSFSRRMTVAGKSWQWREIFIDGTLYSFPVLVALVLIVRKIIHRVQA